MLNRPKTLARGSGFAENLRNRCRFGELLDRVVRGEEIVITRHEKAVARLVPEGGANLKHTQQVVALLRAGRSLMAKRRGVVPLTDGEIMA